MTFPCSSQYGERRRQVKFPKDKNKLKNNKNLRFSDVYFELEDNALELMEEHLATFKPHAKDADTKPRQESLKKSQTSAVIEIDLHGSTVDEAERIVAAVIARHEAQHEVRTFKIITGKGRHSSSGRGVLIREIYLFVVHRYGPRIVRIEEAPDGVRIGGQAIRGHFHVSLKGP